MSYIGSSRLPVYFHGKDFTKVHYYSRRILLSLEYLVESCISVGRWGYLISVIFCIYTALHDVVGLSGLTFHILIDLVLVFIRLFVVLVVYWRALIDARREERKRRSTSVPITGYVQLFFTYVNILCHHILCRNIRSSYSVIIFRVHHIRSFLI